MRFGIGGCGVGIYLRRNKSNNNSKKENQEMNSWNGGFGCVVAVFVHVRNIAAVYGL